MPLGRVVYWKEEGGYGFLRRDDGEEPNVFFHVSQWLGEGDPLIGDRVRFDVGDTPKRPGKRMAFRVFTLD